jgi:soluble lytic murein transglycosylase-like protein
MLSELEASGTSPAATSIPPDATSAPGQLAALRDSALTPTQRAIEAFGIAASATAPAANPQASAIADAGANARTALQRNDLSPAQSRQLRQVLEHLGNAMIDGKLDPQAGGAFSDALYDLATAEPGSTRFGDALARTTSAARLDDAEPSTFTSDHQSRTRVASDFLGARFDGGAKAVDMPSALIDPDFATSERSYARARQTDADIADLVDFLVPGPPPAIGPPHTLPLPAAPRMPAVPTASIPAFTVDADPDALEPQFWNAMGDAPLWMVSSGASNAAPASSPARQDTAATPGTAGLTAGLAAAQKMSPAEVFQLRNSGTPIHGKSYTKTDAIAASVGWKPAEFSISPAAVANNLNLVQGDVATAGKRHGVSTDLLNAVIVIESKGVENAVSPTGALGVSQLTYGIYGSPGAVKAFGSAINPFVPGAAIDRSAALLGQLSRHYDGDRNAVVAAYNQGQAVVDGAMKNHGADWALHIPAEGRNYITTVNSILAGGRNIPGYFGTPEH